MYYRIPTSSRATGHTGIAVFRAAAFATAVCLMLLLPGQVRADGSYAARNESAVSPNVYCHLVMPSELEWSAYRGQYHPHPFTVQIRAFNTGSAEATKTVFIIAYDTTSLRLVKPMSAVQPGSPVDVPPDGESSVEWDFAALQRLTSDSVRITVTASFDNHDTIVCTRCIWIPQSRLNLSCRLLAPAIIADDDNQKYVPMPFNVKLELENTGTLPADSISARIVLQGKLCLAGQDAPHGYYKTMNPAVLESGGKAIIEWTVAHPISLTEIEYVIKCWVKNGYKDSILYECAIVIPPLMSPVLQANCVTPSKLIFDAQVGDYSPNPFPVVIQVINMSPAVAENVSAFLWLPGNVEFDPPNQTPRQWFGTLTQYRTGDHIPEKTWTIRRTKRLRVDETVDFKWSVAGTGATGKRIDTVNAFCTVEVPGLLPYFDWVGCSHPDSLVVTEDGTDVTPNPFTITETIKNTSFQTAAIKSWEVFYSAGDGVELDSTSPPKRQDFNKVLLPGDSLTVRWVFRVQNRITRRLLTFNTGAIDDEGNPLTCQHLISVAALSVGMSCALKSTVTHVVFDSKRQRYTNDRWKATYTLTNAGGMWQKNVSAEMSAEDQYGLIELDPAYPNPNPQTLDVLKAKESHDFVWYFRLRQRNETGTTEYAILSPTYSTNELPQSPKHNCWTILIDPVIPGPPVTEFEDPDSLALDEPGRKPPRHPKMMAGDVAAGGSLWLRNHPNPFNPSTTIEYQVPSRTHVRLEIVDMLGRCVAVLADETLEAGMHTASFNGSNAQGGVYLCRLTAGNFSAARYMVLAR